MCLPLAVPSPINEARLAEVVPKVLLCQHTDLARQAVIELLLDVPREVQDE